MSLGAWIVMIGSGLILFGGLFYFLGIAFKKSNKK
ncbi:MetS family NSS transporter small subunit [Geotoga petraea]|jgi:uncharacterized membrane protein|uniref:MetS family NSS transporter small subunit n=1 Tax=Geotoga petraea TaxID=28234 RepID=A0A1G6HP19_9BACT|nr:hypothetical protein [Geotoga sp.]SDB95982.1 hypothetical protein SAMN04488588_0039 [Geotoga petraea]